MEDPPTKSQAPAPMNIARLCGLYRSKCGYCEGSRASILSKLSIYEEELCDASASASASEQEIEEEEEEEECSKGASSSLDGKNEVKNDDKEINDENDCLEEDSKQRDKICYTAENSSKCYGVVFDEIQPADYLALINRGWRRSGNHLYLPMNTQSCCPAIPIRLNVEKFVMSSSQKKVLKQMNKCLNSKVNSEEFAMGRSMKRQRNAKEGFLKNDEFVENSKVPGKVKGLCQLKPSVLNLLVEATIRCVQRYHMEAFPDFVLEDPILQKVCKFKPRREKKSKGLIGCATGVCCAIFARLNKYKKQQQQYPGIELSTLTLSSFAAQVVERMKMDPILKNDALVQRIELLPSGQIVIYLKDDDDITGPVAAPVERSFKQNHTVQSQEDYLAKALNLPTSNTPHKLTVRSIPCSVSNSLPEVHKLYAKYQEFVHHDPNPYKAVAAAVLHKGKFHKLEAERKLKQSKKNFERFLCSSPIPYCDANMQRIRLGESWASREDFQLDDKGFDVYIPFGSYHQHYRIDGKLIAVGVVDILPSGLSSVYSFYDPSISYRNRNNIHNSINDNYASIEGNINEDTHHLNLQLGKFTALREIEWVQRRALSQRVALSSASPLFLHYFLGYYIHSCPKMRYKAEYKPSQLLVPRKITNSGLSQHLVWLDYMIAKQKLDKCPYEHYYCTFPELTFCGAKCDSNADDDVEEKTNAYVAHMQLDIGQKPKRKSKLSPIVTVGMLSSHGRAVVDPLMLEFLHFVGLDVSKRCIIRLQ